MKKILFLFVMILPCVSHAANMCIKNDAVMVVLDPQIAGTALANNATGKTWSTKFSYGVISGIGGCVQGTGANQTDITAYTTGNYCYCKMLRPIESPWVYSGYNGGSCASACASNCSSYAASAVALRTGLFGNIGI